MTVSKAFVEVAGLSTRYLKAGDGPTVIVLLHGASPGACSEVNWSRNLSALASSGFTVYAFDQPGFGETENPSDFSVEFRVDHAKAFLDAMGLNECCLVGNSMGGYIAARLAMENRGIQGLVLVSPVPLLPRDSAPNSDGAAHSAKLRAFEPGLENMRALTSGTIFSQAKITAELVELRHRMSVGKNYEAQKARAHAPRQKPIDLGSAGLTMKVLILWGAQDGSVSADWALPLCRALPHSELHIFGSCGHWPQWEYPDKFNRLVHEFLQA